MKMESIVWKDPAEEMPDDDKTVLLFHPGENEPVWPGYRDTDTWRTAEGSTLGDDAVRGWAEMPGGPEASR